MGPYFEGGMVSTELFIWLRLINQVTDCIQKIQVFPGHTQCLSVTIQLFNN